MPQEWKQILLGETTEKQNGNILNYSKRITLKPDWIAIQNKLIEIISRRSNMTWGTAKGYIWSEKILFSIKPEAEC